MKAIIEFDGRAYRFDLAEDIDISIPVRFDGRGVRAFGAPPAKSAPYDAGDWLLDIKANPRAGVNCPVFTFAAHLHGTHTECAGHISRQDYKVQDVIGHPSTMVAVLVSVEPVEAQSCGESYSPGFEPGDHVITRAGLEKALSGYRRLELFKALVIRTLPNDENKKIRDYSEQPWPFFSNEAMKFIVECGFAHLLLDMPSVDREEDGGTLSNHHYFWNVPQGSNDVPQPSKHAITELIYVPNEVRDGVYALQLNIANIRSDAAPSRPVLYTMETA